MTASSPYIRAIGRGVTKGTSLIHYCAVFQHISPTLSPLASSSPSQSLLTITDFTRIHDQLIIYTSGISDRMGATSEVNLGGDLINGTSGPIRSHISEDLPACSSRKIKNKWKCI